MSDTFSDILPAEIPDYVSLFRKLFGMIDNTVRYEIFDVRHDIYPDSLNRDELYLITGSRAEAYGDSPWIKSLIEFIRKMYAEGMKIAGVCFGHQIIAQTLGGKVERAKQGWGTGVRTADITDPKALTFFPAKRISLFCNHHDQVTELPPRAVCFAKSDFCPVEGFYIDNQVLTFQGHPEHTAEYVRYLLLNHSDGEREDVKTAALASLTGKVDSSAAAQWIKSLVR
ncbi:MAG: hypothetical protein LBQ70_07560 [Prevotellaceae bacterium]|nr:hypothetical protein [Prevotellaceae bacterium]